MSADWPRIIVHADMDAFYAAVEQLDDPRLRGRLLLVGSDGARRRADGELRGARVERRQRDADGARQAAVPRSARRAAAIRALRAGVRDLHGNACDVLAAR